MHTSLSLLWLPVLQFYLSPSKPHVFHYRTKLFATSRQRIHQDGLNSLKYELLDKELMPLYTWLYVRINQTEILLGQNLLVIIKYSAWTESTG